MEDNIPNTKGCLYDLLGVEKTASEDEIKRAYKKTALKWHPDKNMHRQEVATEVFQAIQSAHQTLTTPNERAWYDAHRDEILSGKSGDDAGDFIPNLWSLFSSSSYKGFDDTAKSFFTVYRTAFESVVEAEKRSEADFSAPSFCSSDSTDDVVMAFYSYWENFSSSHTFSWCDAYDTREAQNRDIRRQMEKENKKFRTAAKKKYTDQVRSLCSYVKSRDIRFIKIRKRESEEKAAREEQAAILKALKDAEIAEAKQAWREERARELQEEDERLQAANVFRIADEHYNSKAASEMEDGSYVCDVCDKVFKSERSYANHEKSKKHQEAVEELRLELLAQDEAFDDDADTPGDAAVNPIYQNYLKSKQSVTAAPSTAGTDRVAVVVGDDAGDGSGGDDFEETEEGGNRSRKGKSKSKAAESVAGEESNDDDDGSYKYSSNASRKKQKKKKNVITLEAMDELSAATESLHVGSSSGMKGFDADDLLDSKRGKSSKGKKGKGPASIPPTKVNPKSDDVGDKEGSDDSDGDDDDDTEGPGVGTKEDKAAERRRLRKEKRKADKKDANTAGKGASKEVKGGGASSKDLQCKTCSAAFSTRSALFDHIEETNHGVTPDEAYGVKEGKGGKKRR